MKLPTWHNAMGATTAAAKWVAGDKASPAEVDFRRDICRTCPSLVHAWGVDWCGPPFEDRTGALDHPTCGCSLVKVYVASEECPQAKWDAVDRQR